MNQNIVLAKQEFLRARRSATLQEIINRISGKPTDLLSYEEVRRKLHGIEGSTTELRDIPVASIVGSVGRYADFTRSFLPRKNISSERWARVKSVAEGELGWPPIDVYQIGDVYFVLDGNHRVSVARRSGLTKIQAYVKEVKTKVPLDPNTQPDDLIIKAEFTEFLDETRFDQIYPEVDLAVTVPGRHIILQQQIEAVHFGLEFKEKRAVPYEEAVRSWYVQLYYPTVNVIRDRNILADFPGRTETDLFLWVYKHQRALTRNLGWSVTPDRAAKDLLRRSNVKLRNLFQSIWDKAVQGLAIRKLDSGPPPGQWREQKMESPEGRLFRDVLVIIDGSSHGWQALEKGLFIARLEGSNLHGLTVSQENLEPEFNQRCQKANIKGDLIAENGPLTSILMERAWWGDLLVVHAALKELKSIGIQALIQSCPIPLLIIQDDFIDFKNVLVAYNGRPKAEEALFLSAFMATFWEIKLTVTTCLDENSITEEALQNAKTYLNTYRVKARYLEIFGNPGPEILKAAVENQIDLIVLGGYDPHTRKAEKENLALNHILSEFQKGILVCR